MYCTVLYCTVLYCTVLYCTVSILSNLISDFLQYSIIFYEGLQALSEILLSIAKNQISNWTIQAVLFILDIAVFHICNIASKSDQSQTDLYYAIIYVLNNPCVQYTEKIIFHMWNIASEINIPYVECSW